MRRKAVSTPTAPARRACTRTSRVSTQPLEGWHRRCPSTRPSSSIGSCRSGPVDAASSSNGGCRSGI